ncbi:TetR/AcrR family transcriptional regulator [Xanthobacter autotrophicus]|uniref:TetR/AcrR family transcriptional regulator n=1 Tax=Xanthobacter autotrophicus TaxID=280 RepID=UPI00372A0565
MLSREGRPTLRYEQQKATRERLLKAAFDVFSEKGYHLSTIKEMVDRAGTSRATFYLHFKTKAEALVAGWKEIQQPKMIVLWEELDNIASPAFDDIRAWIEKMLDSWEADRRLTIASNQAVALEPELAGEWLAGMREYLGAVPRCLERMAKHRREAEMNFLLLCAQMDRVVFLWLSGAFPASREQIIDALADQWAKGLQIKKR